MNINSKVYVAGHTGLVGSAVHRALSHRKHNNLTLRTHSSLDLTDFTAVNQFFEQERPEIVFLCAAKVGGIIANNTYPADFILINTSIALNVIRSSWMSHVKRLIFLGSSCIYPKICSQPIKEDALLSGYLEPTNRPYAIAKIAGIEMCWSFNRQYGTSFLSAMPCNLYGIGDNYNLETSHVIPAMIRKIHFAKINNSDSVELYGTGRPLREFLFADDLADALLFLSDLSDNEFNSLTKSDTQSPIINIGSGKDISISDLASIICRIVGYQGSIIWNNNKPDGTPRKLLDISKIQSLGWTPKTDLETGIKIAYDDFLVSYPHL